MAPVDPKRKQEIIEKIQACFRRSDTTRGASQAEAETAVKMAKRLMMGYNLSQAEVETADLSSDTDGAGKNIVEEGGMTHYKHITLYESMLSQVCEMLFNVKPLLTGKWDKKTGKSLSVLVFIGYETDVALAREVYNILRGDVNALERELGKQVSWSDKESYRLGVVHSLLARAREQVKDATKEQVEKCTALMVVKNQAVDNYMAKQYPNLSFTHRRYNTGDAYRQGREDGSRISLNFNKRLQ